MPKEAEAQIHGLGHQDIAAVLAGNGEEACQSRIVTEAAGDHQGRGHGAWRHDSIGNFGKCIFGHDKLLWLNSQNMDFCNWVRNSAPESHQKAGGP